MSASDGYVLGTVKVVDHGSDGQRYNIVILGDGYRTDEQAKYKADVTSFVTTLRAAAPFDTLWCGINVHRVDVVSTDSGTDDPVACGDGSAGSGASPRTYFDSMMCGDGNARRLLVCDSTLARNTAQAQVPQVHVTMVIVNTPLYGGSGGSVATFSTDPSAAEIALHEMGHTAFGFADEYEYYLGCASGETGHDHHPNSEPTEPNVTVNTNRATLKWNAELSSATDALPTTSNANCAQCDTQSNPHGTGYVGLYEGAHYYHCGAYRPQYSCRMRALNNPFCAVCQRVIRNTLAPFQPAETIALVTPAIAFIDVPEGVGGVGVTTWRAIRFDVVTCRALRFRITAGPGVPFGTPLGTQDTVTAVDANPVANARIWLSYTSTTAGATASGSVTVRNDETGQTWVIPITANTVARPKSAISLVLDHSGSMSEDVGDGTTKVAKLREAAGIFVNAMLQGDSLSIVRFDDTSQILMPVTDVGPTVTGAGRTTANGILTGGGLDPAGATSIGAGVQNGKQTLDDAQALGTPHYDVTAMLVLTDGMENTAPMLSDVSSSITANTFAIGLGIPENISVAALNVLTQGHNGYLLVTGALNSDQTTRLTKYFLQILAGVTNANVVLDPPGVLLPGTVQRIPFSMSEADYGLDVFVLCEMPWAIQFALEAPDGTLITPATGGHVQYVVVGGLAYYRLGLPAVPAQAVGTHGGTWNVLLALGGRYGTFADKQVILDRKQLRYDVVVHTYSSLQFHAHLQQSAYAPGSRVSVQATLHEYDQPVEHRANCWSDVTRPDGSSFMLTMTEDDPGRFDGAFTAMQTGLYTIRVRAMGTSIYGQTFTREQTLSAVIVLGRAGDPNGRPDGTGTNGDPSRFWCEWLTCALRQGAVSEKLIEQLRSKGLDLSVLLKCLEQACKNAGCKGCQPDPSHTRIIEQIKSLLGLAIK
ncbi:hypothetical protein WL77_32375 [Burkholderia ubonensis]|uniref:M64 family metallopeptidase n=1 Tax=Burkholderia ubonensis TaxID=101571 RepID=UPI00075A8497|nr:M64 family metallopeptidase [Burkholderia ubonensis]KWE76658.1 hypothetical protein WL77_32375 [Burkholderia ubonensis]KWE77766.1 hypothetical protein WL79_06675 [Burkholderia ubonensis]